MAVDSGSRFTKVFERTWSLRSTPGSPNKWADLADELYWEQTEIIRTDLVTCPGGGYVRIAKIDKTGMTLEQIC